MDGAGVAKFSEDRRCGTGSGLMYQDPENCRWQVKKLVCQGAGADTAEASWKYPSQVSYLAKSHNCTKSLRKAVHVRSRGTYQQSPMVRLLMYLQMQKILRGYSWYIKIFVFGKFDYLSV